MDGLTTTVLMEASSFPGRVYFELPEMSSMHRFLSSFVHHLFDDYYSSQGDPTPFFAIRSPPRPATHALAEGLQKWLSTSLKNEGVLAQIARIETTDFDDPRVRPFEKEERNANLAYLTACGKLNDWEFALSAMDGMKIIQDAGKPLPFAQMSEQLRKAREELEPRWWKNRTT